MEWDVDQKIDQVAFYILSLSILTLGISTRFLGYRKASIIFLGGWIIILLVFLIFGVVVKDIHGVSLPMKEISVYFFGFLKALLPMVWLAALLSSVAEKKASVSIRNNN